MNLLRNAKVKNKLFFMAGTFLFSLIVVGLIGYYYLQASNDKIKDMYSGKLLAIEYLEGTRATYNALNRDLFELMATKDNNRNNELTKAISSEKEILIKNITNYTNTNPDTTFEIDTLKQLNENFAAADKLRGNVVALAVTNKNDEAYELYNKSLSPVNQKIEKNISDLVNNNIKEAEELNTQNVEDFTKARVTVLGIIVLALTLGTSISIFITNLIVKPIKTFQLYIEKVADGDLSVETLEKSKDTKIYNDEIGKLGSSIINMRQKLWEVLMKVSEASEHIAASSQELNANAEESSKGIEETAKAVNTISDGIEVQLNTVIDTSTVIQEMSGSTQQVAANTRNTAKVADKTLEATNEGEKAISTTKEQMNNIQETVIKLDKVIWKLGEKSNEIGQIIEAISSIAEQTNLLALNAAIEAARAGEQGKGFSVVAEEVRKLAEDSKESTGKISNLINEIQQDTYNAVSAMNEGTSQVRIGMEVMDNAGQAFGDISKLVQEITSQIQEVETASESIAEGSQQIVSSMKKVDGISKDVSSQAQTIAASVQEQTASMHEIASSSEGIAKIGEALMTEISKFKL